jgi:mono/diheme cytochrome c family protein
MAWRKTRREGWTASTAARKLATTDDELATIATEYAVARGRHLAATFYACAECHGTDFGGGVMVDDPAMGRLLGPNLTTGAGSRTLAYTAADWDRMVRHGVKPDGTGSPMPSRDYFVMSDRELSDIVSYIRSMPPVDKAVPAVSLGPVMKALVATGRMSLSAEVHPTRHALTHAALPPAEVADATYGRHLAQTCSGCHGAEFAGGPIVEGPPDWPPAANLTPAGLAGWTVEDFRRALVEGRSKDGRALRAPMAGMTRMAAQMTDVELRALWAFFSTLPPRPAPR